LAVPAQAAGAVALHPAAPASSGELARVLDYWTPQQMRSARPLDEPLGASLATMSYAPVAEPSVPPNVVNGRLFIRQKGQKGYCSATAIDSPSRQLVLTAGHCVNSGPLGIRGNSAWSRYVLFVPAYSNGIAPFGAFPARRNAVFALPDWVQFANPNFDVGAILVSPNRDGHNVADAVGGGVSIVLNQSRHQQFQTFGYPGKTRAMQACESPYVGDDSLTYQIPGPPTMAIRCHWAPGASGGGWLIGEGTAINGLTSYGKRRDKVHTFSPYFGQRNVGQLVAGK